MVNWQLQDLMIYNNLETDCSQSSCHFSFFLEWIENVSKDPPVKVDLETEVSEPFSLKEVHMLIYYESQTLNLDKNFKQLWHVWEILVHFMIQTSEIMISQSHACT